MKLVFGCTEGVSRDDDAVPAGVEKPRLKDGMAVVRLGAVGAAADEKKLVFNRDEDVVAAGAKKLGAAVVVPATGVEKNDVVGAPVTVDCPRLNGEAPGC